MVLGEAVGVSKGARRVLAEVEKEQLEWEKGSPVPLSPVGLRKRIGFCEDKCGVGFNEARVLSNDDKRKVCMKSCLSSKMDGGKKSLKSGRKKELKE